MDYRNIESHLNKTQVPDRSKKNNKLIFIILFVILGFFLLGIIGASLVGYIWFRGNSSQKSNDILIHERP